MSMNWLEGVHQQMDGQMEMGGPGREQAMPVFAGQKLVVVGGSSGMGRQTAEDVVAVGGSAVIIGQDPGKVEDTVAALARDGKAWGITADLADREQVERVRQQLADEHADATLLVNAAGFFIPRPFLDYDGASYDAYLELDRAIFFLTQTVARGMVAQGKGGSIVNIGSMWAHQAIAATPSSGYSVAKGGLHALTHNLALELGPHHIRSMRSPRPSSPPRSTSASSRLTSSRRPCIASTACTRWAGPAPPATWPTPSPSCCPRPPAGSPAPSGTSTAASWPGATNHPGTAPAPGQPPCARATPQLWPGWTCRPS
jgi:NADP-dependent 3-hydroxy acid dehydrogenase YdfG